MQKRRAISRYLNASKVYASPITPETIVLIEFTSAMTWVAVFSWLFVLERSALRVKLDEWAESNCRFFSRTISMNWGFGLNRSLPFTKSIPCGMTPICRKFAFFIRLKSLALETRKNHMRSLNACSVILLCRRLLMSTIPQIIQPSDRTEWYLN